MKPQLRAMPTRGRMIAAARWQVRFTESIETFKRWAVRLSVKPSMNRNRNRSRHSSRFVPRTGAELDDREHDARDAQLRRV